MKKCWIGFALLIALSLPTQALAAAGDIVFVTQVPQWQDFATIGSTFANHGASLSEAPRGGDLYIRYADGTLRNLTRLAGYGVDGFQGETSIAVRDPAVHWSGSKVLFSMVIGSVPQRYQVKEYRWQLYEVSGLDRNQTPVITKVPNQPSAYNNVMGTYGTDDRIIFSSDRPRNGASHLYPQRDEYESTKTNTGIWSLDPTSGDLFLLDHTPSGAFHPFVDSFGRVIYTRWDHLQRDQQAGGLTDYGAFNFSSEAADTAKLNNQLEVYPEPRSERERTQANLNLHTFNHFFPWQINEDGTEHETLNHVGRHELHSYFDRTFNDDGNLEEYYGQLPRNNPNDLENFFQIREDPRNPGIYFGIDAPEFETHASGQILKMNGAPTTHADQMYVSYVTARETASTDETPGPSHSGHYRNPLPMSSGALVASHTSQTGEDRNIGTSASPISRYQFLLKTLRLQGGVWIPDVALTGGITKSLSYWDPDTLISFNGPLWELQPVELVARTRPARRSAQMESPELSIFQEEGVDVAAYRQYLKNNSLALIVTRNVTSRDATDVQQPLNLRVANTNTQKVPFSGKIYDVAHLQIFQGDLRRGYGGVGEDTQDGRRVLATPLHSSTWANPANGSGPQGSVKIAADGSMAALVPARRALTWQLTNPSGEGVVRERYWLTFQPGEIRVCASCHGLISHVQIGLGAPQNKPEALRQLLALFRDNPPTPPNGPDDPANPGDPNPPVVNTPSYVVSVTSAKKKKPTQTSLLSGWSGAIYVFGQNAASANKAVELRMSIDGVACPNPINYFNTNAQGHAADGGKVPAAKKNLALSFQVLYQGQAVGSGQTLLLNGKRKQSNKPLSAKDQQKMCRAFEKF